MTFLSSIGARGINVMTALISITLASTYLGDERLGVWMTISGLAAFLSFADLGIGNGLVNAIADAHGRNDEERAAHACSSAVAVLSLVALAIAVLFALAQLDPPWPRLFNLGGDHAEVAAAMAVYCGCFLANLPLSVVERVRVGYQESYVNQIYGGAGNLLSLPLVVLTAAAHGGLPLLVLACELGPLLGRAANGLALFGWQRRHLRPRIAMVTRGDARGLLGTGMFFLLLQASAPFILSVDKVLVAQLFGAEAVPGYSIPLRLFEFAGGFIGMAVLPFWPAYAEAIARNDVAWIRQTMRRLFLATAAVGGGMAAGLTLSGNWLIELWVGAHYRADPMLLLGIGTTTLLLSVGAVFATFLNAAGKLAAQTAIIWTGIGLALALRIAVGPSFGLAAFAWAGAAGFLLFKVVPHGLYALRVLRGLGPQPGARGAPSPIPLTPAST